LEFNRRWTALSYMSRPATTSLLLLGLLAHPALAEERQIPELRKVLVLETVGPASSDAASFSVRLEGESGDDSVRFPDLRGPIFVSAPNRQLFSCESNASVAATGARAFDLTGEQVFLFPHAGFLRNCGLTGDQRFYWLIYNVIADGEPRNVVVVLDPRGVVVADARFAEARAFSFSIRETTYTVQVPEAEPPG